MCSVPLSCLLSSLLLSLSCNSLKICRISRFKGVLSGFWGADVYLYGLRALRGLWGFYVREWLGGFGACCVFCPFVFFSCPLVLLSPAVLLGFLPCLLSCSLSCFLGFVAWLLALVGLLAFFPFRTAPDTKKGRIFCVPSSVGRVVVFRVLPELRNYCRRFQS